jgi:hypothetical protein
MKKFTLLALITFSLFTHAANATASQINAPVPACAEIKFKQTEVKWKFNQITGLYDSVESNVSNTDIYVNGVRYKNSNQVMNVCTDQITVVERFSSRSPGAVKIEMYVNDKLVRGGNLKELIDLSPNFWAWATHYKLSLQDVLSQ